MQNIWGNSSDNDIASLRIFMATLRKRRRGQTLAISGHWSGISDVKVSSEYICREVVADNSRF